jgi:hypothetical protein
MKTTLIQTAVILSILASPLAIAADDHKHEEHVSQGPNGGHVIRSKAGFTIEVTVDKERKARVIFLDKENKAVALGGQSITGIAGERSAPTKLAFAAGEDADANVLISDNALPSGAHIPMILSIQTAPDANAVTERFELHLH